MKLHKLNKKGFTIVELLIVIVIIGILATIGFVAFSGAQNKAKKSTAESTVSQVKSKLGEYYADKSEYPANKAAVKTFLSESNNTSLNDKFGADTDTDYTYACNAEDAGGCESGFTLTASKTIWSGSADDDDIIVTN